MSNLELQAEEREVLSSIYDGDECYKQITPTSHQYKFGMHDTPKSFVLEINWNETYPNTKPEMNMNAFYNKHILQGVKDNICNLLDEEAEQYLGISMTYSLFEFIKEKFDVLIQEQPAQEIVNGDDIDGLSLNESQDSEALKKVLKKEHLTKAQKRKQWDRIDGKGERPRGWDWVDIVKHLSQTGNKEENA